MPLLDTSTLRTIYLGGETDIGALPVPDSGLAEPGTRGGSLTKLIGGGSSSVAFARVRRSFSYNYVDRDPDVADAIVAFWSGVRGAGPWMLVSPAWRNQQALDISTLGKRTQTVSGWSSSITAAAPTYDTALAPAVSPNECGVMRWAVPGGHSVDALLLAGSVAVSGANLVKTPDTGSITAAGTAVPRLIDQPHTLSIYAQAESGSANVQIQAFVLPGSGSTAAPVVTGPTVAVSSSGWTRLSVVLPANTGPITGYVVTGLYTPDGSPPPLLFSNPQHEIGVTAPRPWVIGLGVPRVVLSGTDNPFSAVLYARRTQQLDLVEI